MRTTRDLANYIYDTNYNDIAPQVIQRTKDLCLSTLGSAVLGVKMDVTSILATYAKSAGGAPEASVIGAGFKTSAELAAMVNGSASHNTELEDVSFPEAMPTVNIIPALFALGEKLKAPGKAVLEGVVLAFEVAARPGTVLTNGPGGAFDRGFQPGPVFAPVAIAGVACKMMGLPKETALNAMSIGSSFSSGMVRQTGAGAHVIEPGLAGRNGITAALFAAEGMTGEPTILEGRTGLWEAVGNKGDIEFDLGQGTDFRIMEVGVKRYPCCYFLQRIVDGVADLVKDNKLTPEDVESIEVQGNEFFRKMIRQDTPENGEEARFSLPHSVAAALTGDRIFFETFTEEAVHNPRYRNLWSKVKFARHPDWLGGAMESDNPLIIRLKNGTELKATCVVHKGDPRKPLSQAEVVQRFKYCAEGYLSDSRMDDVANALYGLDKANDVSGLMNMLTYRA